MTGDLYFGRVKIHLVEGKPLAHVRDGVYTSANSQGVMGAGFAAEIRRVGGADIERELRLAGPLGVGQAYVTGPGDLDVLGVKAIAHGVVVERPGDRATLDASMKGLLSGLRLLEHAGCRSVTIPLIGWRVAALDPSRAAAALGDVVISHLRRGSRLEHVLIAGTHTPYLEAIDTACRRHAGATT